LRGTGRVFSTTPSQDPDIMCEVFILTPTDLVEVAELPEDVHD
jgi:hypothetical protein